MFCLFAGQGSAIFWPHSFYHIKSRYSKRHKSKTVVSFDKRLGNITMHYCRLPPKRKHSAMSFRFSFLIIIYNSLFFIAYCDMTVYRHSCVYTPVSVYSCVLMCTPLFCVYVWTPVTEPGLRSALAQTLYNNCGARQWWGPVN